MMKKKLISTVNASTKKIPGLSNIIRERGAILSSKKVTAGFDGFVDTIVRAIKNKPSGKPAVFFNTKKAFGNYIIQKESAGFSLELEEISIKPGGNMPIMANAMGHLGLAVNCVGAIGYPQLHPVFNNMSANCSLHSFTDPGLSTAMEFNDGKIILGQMRELNKAGWDIVKSRIGIDKLVDLYNKSDLLCMLNWAEIDASGEIWEGLLKYIFPRYKTTGEKQLSFFDLADFSKRGNDAVEKVIGLIKKFSRYTNVTVGLNQNEAALLYKIFFGRASKQGLAQMGEKIFQKLSVDILVLHSSAKAVAFNKEGLFARDSFFIKDPAISTGAGDNFNAGFCAGRLMHLDLQSTLIFAHAVSALYIRAGTSPELPDVINFLEKTTL